MDDTIFHAAFIYGCEKCGKKWYMYCEEGIEEKGDGGNHKPSPFIIRCPHCGGYSKDISGILRFRRTPSSDFDCYSSVESGYFANIEGEDCGVPVFPWKKEE